MRMRRTLSWVRALVVVTACAGCAGSAKAPAAAASPIPTTAATLPPDLQEQVARASAIGRQLYILDQVSAIATDTLFAELPDVGSQGLGGYIPLRAEDYDGQPTKAFVVSFFTRDDPPRVAYEVRVTPDEKPQLQVIAPPKPLLPSMVPLVRARQLAIDAVGKPAQPLNPVVLRGEALGEHGILVYLLAGTTKPHVAVLGKHTRALISDDATRIVKLTPLSKGILELPTEAPGGARTTALTVTHVVTDFPLETHVFASLLAKLPIYVATRRGLWLVDGDRIDFLGAHPPGESPQASIQ